MSTETWSRVGWGRTRQEALNQFVQWRERTGSTPTEADLRVNWGTYADGLDYWEVLVRQARDDER